MEQNLLINILEIIATLLLFTNILLGIVCIHTKDIYRKLHEIFLEIYTVKVQQSNK